MPNNQHPGPEVLLKRHSGPLLTIGLGVRTCFNQKREVSVLHLNKSDQEDRTMKKHINEKIGDKIMSSRDERKVRFMMVHQKIQLIRMLYNGRIYA